MMELTDSDIGSTYWLKHRKLVKLNDEIFVFCHMHPFSHSFYVKAKVTEMIYIWNVEGRDGAWHIVTKDDETLQFPNSYSAATGEWTKSEPFSLEELNSLRLEGKAKIVNQMPWVDWPLGHAAYLDDDGFATLAEARKTHGRFPGRKLGRRMKTYIRNNTTFNLKTHGEPGPKWAEIKSYMRKGYV